MKILLLSALTAVVLSQPIEISDYALSEWEDFKTTYMKRYETVDEEDKRKNIFMSNFKYISEHNEKYRNGEKKYYLGTNKFADMTAEEIKSKMNNLNKPASLQRSGNIFQKSKLIKDLPWSIDWSTKGAVTKVKNQMACSNGGWAFSATGALEGQLFLTNGTLVSLSEQNLIDCSKSEGNDGCEGGSVDAAFTYVTKTGGMNSEMDYTFDDGTGPSCRYIKSKRLAVKVKESVKIESGDEEALQEAVATIGPIAAAIDAQENDFVFYRGGVYENDWCFNTAKYLNHYVLVVGYDYDYQDGDYWILKNSWGQDWGLGGYMYLAKGDFNLCGIATSASYPVLA